MHIATPSAIGDHNKYAILELIKNHDGISREELARTLALSTPAVSKNVNALIEAGIIYENGTAETQMGRKPMLLYYNSRLMYVVSAEIMPQGIRGALADFAGNIMVLEERPSNVEDSVEAILASVTELIRSLCDQRPVESEVACVCVASPGCTDSTTFFNLLSTYQEAWADVNLMEELESRLGITAIVRNDVELNLTGECWRGAGRECKNILLVTYGDGFACRAMVDGHMFRGARCMAGEIGYLITSIDQVRDTFRSPGVLEQRLSRDIFAEYRRLAGDGADLPAVIKFPWLLRRANEGDALAERFVREATDLIAVAVNNAVLVLNPEMIILAGDAAELRKSDVAHIADVLERSCPMAPVIQRAHLGKNAGIYGGIRVALQHADKKLVELWK